MQKLIATASAQMKHPQFPIATLPITATTSSENNPPSSTASVVAAKGAQMVQPTFPQGSILVMPHPQHTFHVLPVFANTAVFMPPNAAATAQKAVETHTSSETAATASKSEAGKTSMHVAAPSIAQAISGTVNVEKTPKSVQNPKPSPGGGQSKGIAIATPAGPAALSAMHAFAIAGFPAPHAFALPVVDPVELATIDFNSKSVEITGEVPIKKIELKPEEIEAGKMAAATMALDSSTSESNKPDVDDGTKAAGDGTEATAAQNKEHGGGQDGGSESLGPVSGTPGMIHGSHTSTEVMSAKMLLSLKGKDWQVSPLDKDAPQVIAASDSSLSLPPSAPQTPSSGRKRKQKPIASVKISDVAISPDGAGILPSVATADKDAVDDGTASAKKKRGRKPKQVAGVGGSDESVTKDTKPTPKGRGRKKHVKGDDEKGTLNMPTGQELLAFLDIPPSIESKLPTPAKTKGRSKEVLDTDKGLPHGAKGSAKLQLEQLKASGASKPMKEYVIETDSESGNDSDSSSTGSSSFTPSSSSSDSSSGNSSSEAAPAEEKTPQLSRGRGGRGRGRGLFYRLP